uniref:Uncharacterized protein n=1 Tax=Ciona intestinalis TaxID=7719 RepID=H2XLF2_CIOIN
IVCKLKQLNTIYKVLWGGILLAPNQIFSEQVLTINNTLLES